MKFQDLLNELRKCNFSVRCKPEGATEFRDFDYWYLDRERQRGSWEIEKVQSENDSSTTLHLSSLRRAE